MSVEIDWNSEEAKGKDWCLYCEEYKRCHFYKIKPVEDKENNHWTELEVRGGYPLLDKHTLHKRPKAEKQSVYTKEMADAGELPTVGMDFIAKEKSIGSRIEDFYNMTVRVLSIADLDGKHVITFTHPTMGIGCGLFGAGWVKPIDQRTDKQKTIDAIKILLIELGCERVIDVRDMVDSIQSGKIPNLKYTGKDNDLDA